MRELVIQTTFSNKNAYCMACMNILYGNNGAHEVLQRMVPQSLMPPPRPDLANGTIISSKSKVNHL